MQQAGAHLGSPGLNVAPVGDVAEMHHERYVHDWIPQHAASEPLGMLSHQVACQESAVGTPYHRHPPLVHQTCMHPSI